MRLIILENLCFCFYRQCAGVPGAGKSTKRFALLVLKIPPISSAATTFVKRLRVSPGGASKISFGQEWKSNGIFGFCYKKILPVFVCNEIGQNFSF
ncbi:hypothetical protein [Parathalassolituus penaei]|uniref:Uncharacterized protein n=1 Tax=Parathalassolituus penaei TaxID=2997323 RepID=A0A9X3ISM8_9GAMM|nr:hypothetical protein [Parathalassolituus penaei]MCY0965049.1 hypothetical protein [Parathalassolituus penaei]